MSQPPPYVRFDNYSAFLPIQGPSLNAEFDRIKTTLDAIMTNLKLAQRDDAKLNNGLVTPDSLAPSVTLLMGGWNPRGAWATSTNYVLKDMVEQPLGSGVLYVCPIGHTAGVFATDLTAGKWTLANVAAKVYTQVFTNSGTYTPRAGIVNCIIESWGGGGGGGGGRPTLPLAAYLMPEVGALALTRAPTQRQLKSGPPSRSRSARLGRLARPAPTMGAMAAIRWSARSVSARVVPVASETSPPQGTWRAVPAVLPVRATSRLPGCRVGREGP
jgi:hypothetical protein